MVSDALSEADSTAPSSATGRILADPRARKAANALAAVGLFYFLDQYLWPSPKGVIVQGILVGAIGSLLALGLALVYRANRIVNFAQADLGGTPAALAVILLVSQGWPFWPSVVVGILTAALLGVVVQRLVIRRFSKAPRLILTVVTIGLSQILIALATSLPELFVGKEFNFGSLPAPFHFNLTISPIIFKGNDFFAFFTVPVVIIAFGAFLRYTAVGIAIRASAENAERAALLGIPVARIETVVWVMASVMSFVAVFLRDGSLGGLGAFQQTGGSVELVFRALAAGVIGRFERFGTILVASLGLGIMEQSIIWHTGRNLDVTVALFAIIVGALLIQRRGRNRADSESSSWMAVAPARPIPFELLRLPEVRWGIWAMRLGLVAVGIVLPLVLGPGRTSLAALVLIYALLGLSLVILTGWAGQISLGQAGFFGIGGAIGGALTLRNWDLSEGLLIAGLVGAGLAVAVGLPALRMRGLHLAVTTLGFAVLAADYLINPTVIQWVPSATDFLNRRPFFGRYTIGSERAYYYLCLIILGVGIAMVRGLRNSRTGRALIGLKDNERAAQAFGINATRAKLTAFAFAGFLAAVAGVLYVHSQQGLEAARYAPAESLRVFTMVVIGGMGSIPGAIVGSLYINGTAWFTDLLPTGSIRTIVAFLGTGVGLIFVLLVLPGGLGSLVYRMRDNLLRRVAERRGIVVPSLAGEASPTAGDPDAPGGRLGFRAPFWWNRPAPSVLWYDLAPFLRRHGRLARMIGRQEPEKRYRQTVWMSYVNLPLTGLGVVFPLLQGRSALAAVPAVAPGVLYAVVSLRHLRSPRGRAVHLERSRRYREIAFPEAVAAGGPQLQVQALEAGYDGVQILFGVDLAVEAGEVVALLGTNGAGKSTALRAISGLLAPTDGRIVFEGADLGGMDAHQVAAMGLGQVPGGRGVFPNLTVAENLRIANWMQRRDAAACRASVEEVLSIFPVLQEKWNVAAGDLSGGQQQMLTLAQTFMTKPRLMMIDELSLGLAPILVEALVEAVRQMRQTGMSIVLVEQSVNVALTVADRAYFLEKGEVRFQGPTADLLDRPDVLRAVFIQGAPGGEAGVENDGVDSLPAAPRRRARRPAGVPPVLEVHDVGVSFGGVRAVSGVSLSLAPGEILGIIGPNGAGKTTLFDLISGFTPAESGRVSLQGQDVTTAGPDVRARLGLGRSFQDARLFPTLTVAETIAVAFERAAAVKDPVAAALNLPGVTRSENAIRARVDELIELLNLGSFRDKFIGELSTGSRRIVDLACVMAHSPTVLLFDEPSSGIAQRETEALGDLMKRIQVETGASLLVIEHDMPLISAVSDRLVAMQLGQVLTEGSPAKVLSDRRVIDSYLGTQEEIIHRSGRLPGSAAPADENGRARSRAPRPARQKPAATRRAKVADDVRS